jgi:hypothetical protein
MIETFASTGAKPGSALFGGSAWPGRRQSRKAVSSLEISWALLGQGFLTGKVDAATAFDARSWFPRFTTEARKANQALVDSLTKITIRKQATPAQIALA